MKYAAPSGLLLSLLANATFANAQQQQDVVAPTSDVCISEDALNRMTDAERLACVEENENAKKIERILVEGRFIGLQVPEVEGRFTLDRNFIEYTPRTGGDFTELLGLLPGVVLGSEQYDASEQGEIQAQRVSIMGAEAWQTGFFLDGMNFNSRQDPSSYRSNDTLINDVEGTTQTFNINQQIIDSITVYTNNVPAQYGSFSGGVVDVETRESYKETEFGFNYRTSRSDWNSYKTFLAEDVTETNEEAPDEPAFEKQILNVNFAKALNEYYHLLVSANYTTSEISKLSLNQPVATERENANVLVKLTQRNLWVDKLTLTANYSPYTSNDIIANAIDSDFEIEGGGFSSSVKVEHGFDSFALESTLSFAESYNSRSANPHYYPWAKAIGREWGIGDPTQEAAVSNQGGYGDLDKTQQTLFFDNLVRFNAFNWLDIEHSIKAGFQYNNESLERQRYYDTYVYNSPITGVSNLNCNGAVFDCVALTTSMTIEELEAQLGEPLDFTNPDHVLAYSNIVTASPQYFALRSVYPEEYIDVNVQNVSFHVTDSMDLGDVTLNAALRADYDDFLQNVNIAPRISGGYRLFGDGDKLITFGANRYYDTNLLSYAVREAQLPYQLERRSIALNGELQGWSPLSGGSDYRYRFENLDTPYNDEIVLGWKQATDWGNYAIEYVKRWRRDQISVSGDPVYNTEDGYYYRTQTNNGKGQNDRISLSWAWQFNTSSFWFNTTYQISEEVSFDEEDVDVAPIDELIFLRSGDEETGFTYVETTLNNLSLAKTEFSQPLAFNVGWTTGWTDTFTTSVTGSYRQAFDDYVATDDVQSSGQLLRICSICDGEEVLNVPVYQLVNVPSRFLVNASATWVPEVVGDHALRFRVDVQNLFDARTYSVTSGTSGIETGRSIWFEVGYQWH
ncbi:TonB-dependent receptor plug domain-containing protein [Alteromonas macleodii]|uniref:TonB-dependent receptor plug domain-containing protein n=1 Tax=Alteromonas macleodii TaxID=28108 RepID=UPI003BF81C67